MRHFSNAAKICHVVLNRNNWSKIPRGSEMEHFASTYVDCLQLGGKWRELSIWILNYTIFIELKCCCFFPSLSNNVWVYNNKDPPIWEDAHSRPHQVDNAEKAAMFTEVLKEKACKVFCVVFQVSCAQVLNSLLPFQLCEPIDLPRLSVFHPCVDNMTWSTSLFLIHQPLHIYLLLNTQPTCAGLM